MMLSERTKVFRIVFFSIFGSIIGGLTAYYLGLLFFDSLVLPIINFYNYSESFLYFKNQINEYGFIYVFIGGFTPLPFKIITLSSGALNIPIWNFLLAATLSRSIRFYLIGFLTASYLASKINSKDSFLIVLAKLIIATSTIYILGLLWLGTLIGWDKPIIALGAKPFLLAEVFKIVLLALITKKILKLRNFI